jgi:hypothetical protein
MAKPSMRAAFLGAVFVFDAGWSSPVARQAHNLKVVGSNPTPATKKIKDLAVWLSPFFCHVHRIFTKGLVHRKT